MEAPVKLPILGVDVPLRGYFFLVPAIIIALHFYFVLQLSGLAEKFREYEMVMQDSKVTVAEAERLRQRLDNSLFAKVLGGPSGRLELLLRITGLASM